MLKDAGEIATPFGQLVVAAGTIADFGAIILLSMFFSGEGGVGSTLVLLGQPRWRSPPPSCSRCAAPSARRAVRRDLVRLQDTTAQIRVRGAIVLIIGFVAVAEAFGLEAILGAFAAGAVLTLVDRDELMTHPFFRRKLEAIGFGLVIPVFFVASGVRFDLDALLDDPSNLAMVPIFLAALVVVRGVPALLYRGYVSGRRAATAGLLQSTSLPFIVAATAIGRELGLLDGAEASALVAAGLLSVVIFPVSALGLLSPDPAPQAEPLPELIGVDVGHAHPGLHPDGRARARRPDAAARGGSGRTRRRPRRSSPPTRASPTSSAPSRGSCASCPPTRTRVPSTSRARTRCTSPRSLGRAPPPGSTCAGWRCAASVRARAPGA